MSKKFTVSPEEIVHQIKLSLQLPSSIKEIVTRKIIANAAAEAGIEIEVEELQQVAEQIRVANNLHRAEDTWLWLEKHGLSLEEFEESVRNQAISAKLAQHLFADQVEPFFVEHQLDYAGVVMYEVVLDDQDLAMELFYAIQEGEIGFYETARQYIQDVELRRAGGYRGVISRRQLKPEISAAVFAANPPKILKPIVTAQGVHLILVEEIIQPQLNDFLRQKILTDLFSAWLKQQMKQFEIIKHLESGSLSSNSEAVA